MPSTINSSDRTTACPNSRPKGWPRSRRLATENGSATPTMNMNEGWIRSHGVTPTHSRCSSMSATKNAKPLPG
jgi:hypothetical protein